VQPRPEGCHPLPPAPPSTVSDVPINWGWARWWGEVSEAVSPNLTVKYQGRRHILPRISSDSGDNPVCVATRRASILETEA